MFVGYKALGCLRVLVEQIGKMIIAGQVEIAVVQWIHVLLPTLLTALRTLGDAPARSLTALTHPARRLGGRHRYRAQLPGASHALTTNGLIGRSSILNYCRCRERRCPVVLCPAHPMDGLQASPLTTRRFDYCGPQELCREKGRPAVAVACD